MSDSGCGGDWEGNSSRRARFSSLPALHARLRLRGAERRGAGAGRRDMVCPATLRRQLFGGKLFTGFRGENGPEGNSSSEPRVPVNNFPATGVTG